MDAIKAVCVYSSSSNAVPKIFFDAAEELGGLLAERRISLVYGGACIGLMGAVARAVHRGGGHVIGVIPGFMRKHEIAYEAADELIATETMRERKAEMEKRADAFVALPGGFGTLEEILEILTLRQLGRHHKPIAFLDTQGFYRPLVAMFEHLYENRFAKPISRDNYHIARTPADALDYIASHAPPGAESGRPPPPA